MSFKTCTFMYASPAVGTLWAVSCARALSVFGAAGLPPPRSDASTEDRLRAINPSGLQSKTTATTTTEASAKENVRKDRPVLMMGNPSSREKNLSFIPAWDLEAAFQMHIPGRNHTQFGPHLMLKFCCGTRGLQPLRLRHPSLLGAFFGG